MNRTLKNLKLGTKISLSLILIIVIVSITALFQVLINNRLKQIQQENKKITQQSIAVNKNLLLLSENYQIIANAVIKKNRETAESKWMQEKNKLNSSLSDLNMSLEDSSELALVKSAELYYDSIIHVFETKILPQISTTQTEEIDSEFSLDQDETADTTDMFIDDTEMLPEEDTDFSTDFETTIPDTATSTEESTVNPLLEGFDMDNEITDESITSDQPEETSLESDFSDNLSLDDEINMDEQSLTVDDEILMDDFSMAQDEFTDNTELKNAIDKINNYNQLIEQNLLELLDIINTKNKESNTYYEKTKNRTDYIQLALVILTIIVVVLLIYFNKNNITKPINNITNSIHDISKGKFDVKVNIPGKDEIGEMAQALNSLTSGLNETATFAREIEKGNFSSDFTPLSKSDNLGNSLLDMRKSLEDSRKMEEERKKEDEKRNWTTQGLAKFGDILRQNDNDLETISHKIIKNLVQYLNANQGGLFIYNDEDKDDIKLELTSAFAYDRKKYYDKEIKLGEGLVGTCAIEKETTYLTNVPQDYMEITSGLGTANPDAILIVPLKMEEQILGVVEIATFKKFEKYQIEFVEKLAENIASTLSSAKINNRTAQLLEQSRQQAEEMAAQEEEMRQNLEELQATQEEAARQSAELQGTFDAINESMGAIDFDINRKITEANNFILSKLGLTKNTLIGLYHKDLINREEVSDEEYDEFWDLLMQGKTRIEERKYIGAGGKEIYFKETFHPIYDAQNNITKIFAIFIDITKNKIQQLELEKQAEELKNTHLEMEQRQKELEKTNKKMLGNSQVLEQAMKKSKEREREISEKNEELATQEEELRQNMEELQSTQEEMERKNAEVQKMNKKLKDNEIILKKALENAEKNKNKFKKKEQELSTTISAISNTSLWAEFAPDGTILEINNQFLELFKIKRENIQGKNHADFNALAKDKKKYKKFWNNLLAGKPQTLEAKIDLPDGREIWLHEDYSPVVGESGKVFKIINIATHITEQVLTEKKLQQTKQDLKQAQQTIEKLKKDKK